MLMADDTFGDEHPVQAGGVHRCDVADLGGASGRWLGGVARRCDQRSANASRARLMSPVAY
jgi:hypothetical protein